MQRLNRPFLSEVSAAPEIVPPEITVEETAAFLSAHKAEEIFERHTEKNLVVIGSDTVVILDGVIYGKPKDTEDAFRMLRALSGRTHEVRTGVTILWRKDGTEGGRQQRCTFTSVTRVTFYELSDEEIRSYIAGGEPMDKAGAYGIQQEGALLVKYMEGDYYTVMGFPIGEIYRRLKEYDL